MVRSATFLSFWLFSLALTVLSKHPQTDSKLHQHEKDLSKEPHTVGQKHNPKYDQDALLGDEADDFRDMSDSDKEIKLRKLFFQMDTNHDGFLSREEMGDWLKGNPSEQWAEYRLKPSDLLTWEFYKQRVTETDGEYNDKDEETLKKNLERDRRRWDMADADHDGALNFTEAGAFFNAESHPGMQDVVVQETLDDLDHNHDGYIDQEEYIGDLWSPHSPSDEEPDWVKEERRHFREQRDQNHDGKLDAAEIKAWLFPLGEDHVESEVSHLISNCDNDKDSKLSEQELVGCHETLIGSPVTNYGELLAEHDEL